MFRGLSRKDGRCQKLERLKRTRFRRGDETSQDDEYASPDPEDDDTGDGSDEDEAA